MYPPETTARRGGVTLGKYSKQYDIHDPSNEKYLEKLTGYLMHLYGCSTSPPVTDSIAKPSPQHWQFDASDP